MHPAVRGDVDWLRRLVTAERIVLVRLIRDASKRRTRRARACGVKYPADAETRIAKILEVTR